MLIATAGHIDHGKTALVRALTGVETDRLPEEKARGISIDLGFAYWRPDDAGQTIGFVDVPGHERFIRTMLAGVGGVDFALIVVAADDGVMPQTVDHVRMLHLLGVARGAVALTKCDKANAAQIAMARAGVTALLTETGLAETGLAGAPLVAVSSTTGAGIAELAAMLRAEAQRRTPPPPHGHFRMAVDRCFSVTGAGTVATGTVLAGELRAGDTVTLEPDGTAARVRGLQSAGSKAERVIAGQRCAVNLAGLEVAEVHRGDWLVDPAMAGCGTRFTARVIALDGLSRPLRHDTRLRLHVGTADLPARLLSRRQSAIAPGTSGMVTLITQRPVHVMNGERFVLRDQSGRELLGGGRVLDPLPPRRQAAPLAMAIADALDRHDPAASLTALLAEPGLELQAGWFARCFNLTAGEAAAAHARTGAMLAGKNGHFLIARTRVEAVAHGLGQALARHHQSRPDLAGMTPRELRQQLPQPPSADLLDWLLREEVRAGRIVQKGALFHLPGHSARFSDAELAHWRALLDWLEDGPPRTVTPAELAAELRVSEGTARALLHRRKASGDLWAVTEERFMLRGHVSALVASAAMLAGQEVQGFTAAQFRDATGIGRNHVIRLLEFFDAIGVTRRHGEARTMQPGHEALTGL